MRLSEKLFIFGINDDKDVEAVLALEDRVAELEDAIRAHEATKKTAGETDPIDLALYQVLYLPINEPKG